MKYKLIIFLSMLCFLVIGFGLTYSFFYSSSGSSIDQKIAGLVFNAKNKENLELVLNDLLPGDTKEYEFSVANISEEKVSDVTVEYELSLETYHFLPLVIELYKVDKEETLILTCVEKPERNENNELVCTTETQELIHSEGKLDNYKLKVTFDKKYNDAIYSNLIDSIEIKIRSWQKS